MTRTLTVSYEEDVGAKCDDDFDGDDHDQNDEMMATKSTYDNSEDDYRTGPAGTFLH